MIKAILGLAVLLAFTAQAHAAIEDDVMELLVKESGSITLFDTTTGADMETKNQLPALMARQLLLGYRAPEHASHSIDYANTYINCKNVTPTGPSGPVVGSTSFDCDVNFNTSTHTVTRDIANPEADSEGGIYLKVSVTRVVYPNAKPVLTTKKIPAMFVE